MFASPSCRQEIPFLLPLTSVVHCSRCGQLLAASFKVVDGSRRGYYYCPNRCPEAYSIPGPIHAQFIRLLDGIELDDVIWDIPVGGAAVLADESTVAEVREAMKSLAGEIRSTRSALRRAERSYFSGKAQLEKFLESEEKIVHLTRLEIARKRAKAMVSNRKTSPHSAILGKEIRLGKQWATADHLTRVAIAQAVFPGGLVFDRTRGLRPMTPETYDPHPQMELCLKTQHGDGGDFPEAAAGPPAGTGESTVERYEIGRKGQGVVIYARTSVDQEYADPSAETQLQVCRRFAEERGLMVYGEFVDSCSPDWEGGQPQLHRMVDFVEGHPLVSAVVVQSLSRLGRELDNLSAINAVLAVLGVAIHLVDESTISDCDGKKPGGE